MLLECPLSKPEEKILPPDLLRVLDRLRFVSSFTGETLREFKAIGSYRSGEEIYETYDVGFENRFRRFSRSRLSRRHGRAQEG